jgi:cytochrome oxidase Cu insertion factor (SCO1/SenC/PrrC family)
MSSVHHCIRTTVVAGLILAGHLIATPMGQASEEPLQPMIGNRAPAFDLATVQGGRLSLEQLKGQIIVLHFGASW